MYDFDKNVLRSLFNEKGEPIDVPAYHDHGFCPPDLLLSSVMRSKLFAFDFEGTGLDPFDDRLTGISLYVPKSFEEPDKGLRVWYPFIDDSMVVDVYVCPTCNVGHYDTSAFKLTGFGQLLCDRHEGPPASVYTSLVSVRPGMTISKVMEDLRPIFSLGNDVTCLAYNFKFDEPFLRLQAQVEPPIAITCKKADPMLLRYLGNETHKAFGLKPLTAHYYGVRMTKFAEATAAQGAFAFLRSGENKKPLGCYAMDDAYYTVKHYVDGMIDIRTQDPSGKLEKLFWDMEMPISDIIQEMETTGVLLDWQHLKVISDLMDETLNKINEELQQFVRELGWEERYNIRSPLQTSKLLFEGPENGGIGLPTEGLERGANGAFPTGDKQIKNFERIHPIVGTILRYRRLATRKNGFVDKLYDIAMKDGKVYPRFSQTGTVIGRLSCSSLDRTGSGTVNMMNQPRDSTMEKITGHKDVPFIRYVFCAEPPPPKDTKENAPPKLILPTDERTERVLKALNGDLPPKMTLYGADYGQIELRVAAHLANEESVIQVFNTPTCDCDAYKASFAKDPTEPRCMHVDLHTRTAELVSVTRALAKNLNFGLLYRMAARKFCIYAGLFNDDGSLQVEYAERVIAGWFEAYYGFLQFHRWAEKAIKRQKFIAYTLTGRRRRLERDYRENDYGAVTKFIQFMVSGSSQDIMKNGMIRIAKARAKKIANSRPAERKLWEMFKFLIQVHDENVLIGPDELSEEIKPLVNEAMIGAAHLKVPLTVNCKSGRSWQDIH